MTVTAPSATTPIWATGLDGTPQGQLPGQAVFSVDEAKHALNPLQHLPVIGMIYREATGETLPAPLAIAGSVVLGAALGPVGVLGTVMVQLVEELFRLGPDQSRPALPDGMTNSAEAGIQPGAATPGGYTTLATTLPDFLGGTSPIRVAAAYGAAGGVNGSA